jgi:hypothetical protein
MNSYSTVAGKSGGNSGRRASLPETSERDSTPEHSTARTAISKSLCGKNDLKVEPYEGRYKELEKIKDEMGREIALDEKRLIL